jgi:hypothetical protein
MHMEDLLPRHLAVCQGEIRPLAADTAPQERGPQPLPHPPQMRRILRIEHGEFRGVGRRDHQQVARLTGRMSRHAAQRSS